MKSKIIKDIILSILLIIVTVTVIFFKIGTVLTGSMLPNIKIGQCVIYTTIISVSKVTEGDIAVYQSSSGKQIVHRVLDVNYSYLDNKLVRQLVMKGDNNKIQDAEKLTEDNYKGKVIYVINNKAVNKILSTLCNMSIGTRLILIICIYIGGVSVCTIIKNRFKEDNEDEQSRNAEEQHDENTEQEESS